MVSAVGQVRILWDNFCGAEGGTRTPTGCPTRPSNVRVCQFRHFGRDGTRAKYTSASASRKPPGRLARLAEAGIEGIADALAQQVVGQHRHEDCQPGVEGEPPRDLDGVLALVQDVAPRRERRLHAEAEERQT